VASVDRPIASLPGRHPCSTWEVHMRSWLETAVALELRRRADAIEAGIAAALERGESTFEYPNPDGSKVVYDLSDWPRVRESILKRAH